MNKVKNKYVALILCIFFGYFGAHKFYEGKIAMGIVYFLTVGLFGIGWIVDIVALAGKPNPYLVNPSSNVNVYENHINANYTYKQDGSTIVNGQLVDVQAIVRKYPNQQVYAIKELREKTGASLTEAKNVLDFYYTQSEQMANYSDTVQKEEPMESRTVICEGCGAPNILSGEKGVCEYCGTPIS